MRLGFWVSMTASSVFVDVKLTVSLFIAIHEQRSARQRYRWILAGQTKAETPILMVSSASTNKMPTMGHRKPNYNQYTQDLKVGPPIGGQFQLT